MIVDPKDDVVMERYISEDIHLQCELSRSSGKVQWFKDGQQLEETGNIQLISEGPYRRLSILCSTADDGGEYICETDGDSVFFQLSVTGIEVSHDAPVLYKRVEVLMCVLPVHQILPYGSFPQRNLSWN